MNQRTAERVYSDLDFPQPRSCAQLGICQDRNPPCFPDCGHQVEQETRQQTEQRGALIFLEDTLAFLGVMLVICVCIFFATIAATSYALYSSDLAIREFVWSAMQFVRELLP